MRVPEECKTKSDESKKDVPEAGTDENEKDDFDPNMFKSVDGSSDGTFVRVML